MKIIVPIYLGDENIVIIAGMAYNIADTQHSDDWDI